MAFVNSLDAASWACSTSNSQTITEMWSFKCAMHLLLQCKVLEPVTHLLFPENYSCPSCIQMPSGAAHIQASPISVNPAQKCLFSGQQWWFGTDHISVRSPLLSAKLSISDFWNCWVWHLPFSTCSPVGLSDQVYLISSSCNSTISAPAHSLSSYFYTWK